ncbi:hypothetical protein FSP39_021924 [Pinctada imbricata]|uniref:Uncharacterized protein n=1 Tax=Pinctada imbricata TaxID=66713 RepID=A0AA88Y0Z6_PINIB|nr:hypothetical protein FSP39_021924 [Pinctada imbricata]
MTCCGGTAAVLGTLGFVAILIGVVTPGWFVLDMNAKKMVESAAKSNSFGLSDSMSGIGSSYSDNDVLDQMSDVDSTFSSWIQIQAEGAGAVILSFIGMILCYIPLCSARKNNKGPAIAAFFLLGASGLIISVLIGQFASAISEMQQASSMLGTLGMSNAFDTGFPYSLLIAGAGAGCVFLGALAAIISVCQMRNDQTGQVLGTNQIIGGVTLSNIVPGIQNVNQGYTILEEPAVMVQK